MGCRPKLELDRVVKYTDKWILYQYQQMYNASLRQFNCRISSNMFVTYGAIFQEDIHKNTITITKVSQPFHNWENSYNQSINSIFKR
jgi:hypothetical protein